MQKDGIHYNFSHRSFQEYFCAYFISRASASEAYRAAEKLSHRIEDNVLTMLRDINQQLLEEHWILPRLNDIYAAVEKVDEVKRPLDYALPFGTLGIVRFASREWQITWSFPKQELYVKYAFLNLYPDFVVLFEGARDRGGSDYKAVMELIDKKLWERSDKYDELKELADALKNDPKGLDSSGNKRGLPFYEIALDAELLDNEWFAKTRLAHAFKSEKSVILKLRNEVADRVNERKKQLQTIFDPA